MEKGNFSNIKSVGNGVNERRVDFGPGYRIYFAKDGNRLIILLGGGTKKRQQSDINKAKKCWEHYKKRKQKSSKSVKINQAKNLGETNAINA